MWIIGTIISISFKVVKLFLLSIPTLLRLGGKFEFDEEKYVGSGVFLFASVLEKFLGLYVSLNAFSQLIATTQQREEPLKQWPPRAGEQILL